MSPCAAAAGPGTRDGGSAGGRSVAFADAVEEVGGGALDALVDVAGPVEGGGPGEGAGGEDAGAAGGAVQGRLLVAAGALAVAVGGVGEQDALGVVGQAGAREVAVGLAGDQAGQLVALGGAGGAPTASGRALRTTSGARLGDPARVLDAQQPLLRFALARARARGGRGRGRLRQFSSRSGPPTGDGASSTCQYMVLADRKTSEVPLSRARSTARRIGTDQYSSWPGKTRPR